MADPRTGKEYMVLERSTSTLNHNINQEKCKNIGGHLPEPRDEQENLFLDSLAAERFALGINYNNVDDQWVFESDGSRLTWLSWANWQGQESWPRKTSGNCVSMICHKGKEYTGHRTRDWTNLPCESDSYFDQRPRSLVCQKSTGESC